MSKEELDYRIESLEENNSSLRSKIDELNEDYDEPILRVYELHPFGTVDAIDELGRLRLLQRDGGCGTGYRHYGNGSDEEE